MLYILEYHKFPDFFIIKWFETTSEFFLLKLKVLIHYFIVKLQGDKLARRILDMKDVNLALVGAVVYAVLMYN